MMMKSEKQKLALHQPARYQIKVPGHLDENWAEWVENMTIMVDRDGEGMPITILTGSVDQAALLGLLRRLNSLGLPLIAVNYLEV